MAVKTWLQRLTDESNLWFNAVKCEDDGDYSEAAAGYMDDAERCMSQNLVRSALSCTCAANCLTKLGASAQARRLYELAGRIYMGNSELALSESIREALWSLREAMESFVVGGDLASAAQARNRYIALAARINPFAARLEDLPEVESRAGQVKALNVQTGVQPKDLPDNLLGKIDGLIASYESHSIRRELDPRHVLRSIDLGGGSKLNEKSIAS